MESEIVVTMPSSLLAIVTGRLDRLGHLAWPHGPHRPWPAIWIAAWLAILPRGSAADVPADRVEFNYYGRIGIGWTESGQVAAGKYMNLGTRQAIGGRLEEGDYLVPGMRYHIRKPQNDHDISLDLVTDIEILTLNGSIVSDLSNGDLGDIKVLPSQAYIEAKNVLLPELTLWIGANLYRKDFIHMCDYFYFNNLPGQGVGAYYRGLDVAVLTHTGPSPFFVTNLNAGQPPPAAPALVQRERTALIAQYALPFGPGTTYVQGLGELHVVPRARDIERGAAPGVKPRDWGAVGGAKLHLDLGGGAFSDASARIGNRIANGADSGASTYNTFGQPGTDGTYRGAYGVELVEHFQWNIGHVAAVTGYGTLHYTRGSTSYAPATSDVAASGALPNRRFDYSFGARSTIYLSDELNFLTEATYQLRRDDDQTAGRAVRLSVAPTLVPTSERAPWAAVEIRLIYTTAFYNQAAVDQRMSPYLQTMGPTKVAHFVGVRSEWLF